MDLKKYKAWTPLSGEPANVEYRNRFTKALKQWKSSIMVGGCVGLVLLGCYAAIIRPMRHTDEWQAVQEVNRKGIDQEAIQPGGMKIWTDPFQRKKK